MYHIEGNEVVNVEGSECEKEYGNCENSKSEKEDTNCEKRD
jgi:hypothetical protein